MKTLYFSANFIQILIYSQNSRKKLNILSRKLEQKRKVSANPLGLLTENRSKSCVSNKVKTLCIKFKNFIPLFQRNMRLIDYLEPLWKSCQGRACLSCGQSWAATRWLARHFPPLFLRLVFRRRVSLFLQQVDQEAVPAATHAIWRRGQGTALGCWGWSGRRTLGLDFLCIGNWTCRTAWRLHIPITDQLHSNDLEEKSK